MFIFEKYTKEKELMWDQFIEQKSVNGTFLQSRRFLNYHPMGRFQDESIIIYNEKKQIVALCPGCLVKDNGKNIFFSHKGSTFGGIIIDKKRYCAKYVIPLVKELKDFLSSRYDEVYLKMTSDIFSKTNMDLFQFAFQYNGFEEIKELSTYIDFSTYGDDILKNFAQGKRTNIHNCEKAGLYTRLLRSDEEIKQFYELLCNNLKKYDTKPVHTLEELLEFTHDRLENECEFFGTFLDDKMMAGSMMFYFVNAGTAHTQYLAADQEYNKLSPMSYMYYSMIVEMKKRGYQRLSWGTVTENMGSYVNMGLLTSKENYGSSYCNNLTYHIIF